MWQAYRRFAGSYRKYNCFRQGKHKEGQQYSQHTCSKSPKVELPAKMDFQQVKDIYNSWATVDKMPWFNDLHPQRVAASFKAQYAAMYGNYGPGRVSGWKEIKYTK